MTCPLEDEFGDIIQKARQGLGLALERVSRESGIPALELQRMESYQLRPTPEQVERLAAALGLHPGRLAQIAAGRWTPEPPHWEADGLLVERITIPGYGSHCYLAGRETDCLLVDPGGEADRVLGLIGQRGWKLRGVLITHGHSDHTAALGLIRRAIGALVWAGQGEVLGGAGFKPVAALADGQRLDLGSLQAVALHTPGHTPGSFCFLVGWASAEGRPHPGQALFTGDTLFAGSLGRSQGPAAYQRMLEGVEKKLLSLPPETRVFPGHGPATTVGQEREHNPFFGAASG